MTIDDKNILWMDLFEDLTYNKKIKLLKICGIGNDLRRVFLTNNEIKEVLSKEEFNKMALCLHDEFLNIKLKQYDRDNIKIITFFSEEYPYLLKEISSPPLCLYCKGNTQLLNTLCVGVVGSRRVTDYGTIVTKQFVKDLVDADITIVSGLASGVDAISHKTAIDNQGKTIAVLAGGLNNIYPISNLNLAKEMIKNNLIISENNPDVKPLAYYFPVRNRIIAGLSKAVLITEAGEKSGALHTINYAIEYNREFFAVPGKINSEMSKGTNKLIKEYSGAIALSADDIIEALGIRKEKNQKNSALQLDITYQSVLDYIRTDKKTFQEILDHTRLKAQELNTILFELEMQGLVIKFANNSYVMA